MADPDSLDAPRGENLRLAALEQEFDELYLSHWTKLVRFFRQLGHPEARALDLAQDSFVQALRALPQFRGEAKLSTWVWSIARNVHLAQVTRGGPALISLDDEGVDREALSFGEDAHLMAQRTARDDCVLRGFRRFAAEHPERALAVALAYVEEFSREELAAILGRTPHAATQFLSQSRARLKPYLEDCRDC